MTIAQTIILGFFTGLACIFLILMITITIKMIREEKEEKKQEEEDILNYINQLEKRIEMLQQENEFYKHNIEYCLNREIKKLKEYLEEKHNV